MLQFVNQGRMLLYVIGQVGENIFQCLNFLTNFFRGFTATSTDFIFFGFLLIQMFSIFSENINRLHAIVWTNLLT